VTLDDPEARVLKLRFAWAVVSNDGVAVKDKAFKHSATVDLADVRKSLTKYLDGYAENTRPFPKTDRPMDMKALRVIALVQNDKTREIVQATQIDVEGKAAGGGQ
jgi:tRNA splicing ligase